MRTNSKDSDSDLGLHKHDRAFDAFFDYNLGLWVRRLDDYLARLDANADLLTDSVGLKWYCPQPIDKTFYSLIIHSPASQRVYELMSFVEPDLSRYANLRKSFAFSYVNELRASFLAYDLDARERPWDVKNLDAADAPDFVPIKISFGCADLEEQLAFYTDILD